jgi:hypothetical protein
LRFNRFRRLVAGPRIPDTAKGIKTFTVFGRSREGGGWLQPDTEFERAVRLDPLGVPIGIELPGGLTYVSTGSGMFELVIKSIRAFINGEAWQVGLTVFSALDMGIKTLEDDYKVISVALKPLRWTIRLCGRVGWGSLGNWLGPLLTRFSLGFSLVGSMSFVTLLITSSLMMPFQIVNNVRIGRG